MNDPRQDAELKKLFGELRAEDARSSPDFHELLAEAKRAAAEVDSVSEVTPSKVIPLRTHGGRRPAWTWGIGGALAAAAMAGVLLLRGGGSSDADFERLVTAFAADPMTGAWHSPTDALLEVPGGQLVTTVPTLGGGLEWLGGLSERPGSNQR